MKQQKQAEDEGCAAIQQADAQDGSNQADDPVWASIQPAGVSDMATIRIFTNNCRGYNSKKESIEKYICEQLKPDVINLEETMLRC